MHRHSWTLSVFALDAELIAHVCSTTGLAPVLSDGDATLRCRKPKVSSIATKLCPSRENSACSGDGQDLPGAQGPAAGRKVEAKVLNLTEKGSM